MSSKGKQRVVRQERLPHRQAVLRLWRAYAKLCAAGRPHSRRAASTQTYSGG